MWKKHNYETIFAVSKPSMVVDKAKFIAVERKPQMIPVQNEFVAAVVVVVLLLCCFRFTLLSVAASLVASFYCPRH